MTDHAPTNAPTHALILRNGQSAPVNDLPRIPFAHWRAQIDQSLSEGDRMSACFGAQVDGHIDLFAVIGRPQHNDFLLVRTQASNEFPSLAATHPQLHLFEREIAEQFGLVPIDHPWPKPVRFHASFTGKDAFGREDQAPPRVGHMPFYEVEGTEIHEVAVGPVHAGVIEPGHFRFQCHGETVLFLEISLGYQHRGLERLLLGGPHPASTHQIEALAGDTTIGHTTTWCRILEGLSDQPAPKRAAQIRAIALELERLANHTGDIGALAGDIGFLPTSSFMGRIRGDYLNLQAVLCGNRFGRALTHPFGVRFHDDDHRLSEALKRLKALERDTLGAMDVFFDSPSAHARLEGTGPVTPLRAAQLGLVGMAARASGIDMDARRDFPAPDTAYWHPDIAVLTDAAGDVHDRARIRRLEIEASIQWLKTHLGAVVEGDTAVPAAPLAPERICVATTEGWRGEIVHAAITDDSGRLARYKIVDPSFHNWSGLALAMRGQQISDFPLCNKSFNLSYCGFDL
ncbi:MAG: hydrogenase [Myxococcales bacterium]|jgi:Ni,Fe-hydrogenase III large subunit|nr:hydrogenase [Myxococcales bacterium]